MESTQQSEGDGKEMSEEFTPEQIRQVLDLDLGPNDSGASTGREL